MNKLYSCVLTIFIALSLQSCFQTDDFELNCEIKGLKTDKLFLVFDDPKSKVDSMFLRDTKFFYTFAPDTFTMMRILSPDGKSIPVFADKGWNVEISGDFDQPKIIGKGANKDYQHFLDIKKTTPDSLLADAVVRFSKEHINSYASAYIIHKYLIDVPHPDYVKIRDAMLPLNGDIKDCRIFNGLSNSVQNEGSAEYNNNHLGYFSMRNRQGEYIYSSIKSSDYTLVNFWASWNERSMRLNDSLYTVAKSFGGRRIQVLNISFDYDRAAWSKVCRDDSEWWIELCDFRAWEHTIFSQMRLKQIPTNILVDKNRTIISTDIYGKELSDKLAELIKESRNKK